MHHANRHHRKSDVFMNELCAQTFHIKKQHHTTNADDDKSRRRQTRSKTSKFFHFFPLKKIIKRAFKAPFCVDSKYYLDQTPFLFREKFSSPHH